MTIDVLVVCDAWLAACPDAVELAGAAAHEALADAAGEGLLVADVVLTDDAEQRRLNRTYRGIAAPTNVLAFALVERGMAAESEKSQNKGSLADAPVLLGDVVLAAETVMREAAEQGKPLADHLRHLVVHGVLHLLGFDHRGDAEAAVMEARETAILRRLGVPDPYRDTI